MAEVSEKFLKGETAEEDTVDIMDYLKVLWKWKGLIIGGTFLCMVVAALVSLKMPKVYQANALLLVADKVSKTVEGAKPPSVDTYVGIIKSQLTAIRVIKELELDKPPYHLIPENLVDGMVSVTPIKGTTLIRVTAEYTDPEKARDIANAIVTSATELNSTLNQDEAVKFRDFLKAQLDEAVPVLTKAEQELLAFKETAEIAKLKKEIEILLEEKGVIEQGFVGGFVGEFIGEEKEEKEKRRVDQGLLGIDRKIEEKNTVIDILAKTLENEKKILVLSQSLSNDSIMKDAVKEASNLPTPALWGVQLKNEQVNPLYEQLEPKLIEALSDLEGLKIKKVALTRDREAIEKRLTDLQKELAQKEMKLESLTRDYELAKEIHKTLKQKFEEARALVAARTQELKLVDPAITPQHPIRPNKKMNTLFGGLVGFIALVILAFLLESISRYKVETSVKS